MDFNLNGGNTAAADAAFDEESMVFDLNGVEESKGFEVLPKGTYDAVVDELEFTTSQSGNAMIKVVFSITQGEFADRKVFDYWVLTGDGAKFALPKVKMFMARVCPDISVSQFNPKAFADEGKAIGRLCQLKLGISTQKKGDYKGEKRNNVKEILSSAGAANSFLG